MTIHELPRPAHGEERPSLSRARLEPPEWLQREAEAVEAARRWDRARRIAVPALLALALLALAAAWALRP